MVVISSDPIINDDGFMEISGEGDDLDDKGLKKMLSAALQEMKSEINTYVLLYVDSTLLDDESFKKLCEMQENKYPLESRALPNLNKDKIFIVFVGVFIVVAIILFSVSLPIPALACCLTSLVCCAVNAGYKNQRQISKEPTVVDALVNVDSKKSHSMKQVGESSKGVDKSHGLDQDDGMGIELVNRVKNTKPRK